MNSSRVKVKEEPAFDHEDRQHQQHTKDSVMRNEAQNQTIRSPDVDCKPWKLSTEPSEKDHIKIPLHQPEAPEAKIEGEDAEFWPLSEKPYCNIILTPSHVNPSYRMAFPTKLKPCLPDVILPLVIKYRGREWQATYNGVGTMKKITNGWDSFVDDNHLNVGDALVFEILELCPSTIKVRAQILRGDFPAELEKKVKDGSTYENAMVLD